MIRRVFPINTTMKTQQRHHTSEKNGKTVLLEESATRVQSPRNSMPTQIKLKQPIVAARAQSCDDDDSSDSSSDSSSMSTSSSSTSRRQRRRCRHVQLRKRIEDRRKMQSMIDRGYSLQCKSFQDDGDDGSVSSLSGYDTDYSTSEGSVGFDGLGNSRHEQQQQKDGGGLGIAKNIIQQQER